MSTPTKIATAAVRLKKPNKNDAQELVLQLSEQYGIPAEEIAPLYTYFMPPVPAKPKTTEQWVGKAVGKKDVRYYLNFYYSDGKRLVGCDGSRIHLMPTDLPEGFYDRALNAVGEQGRYPDVDRVIDLSGRDEHTVVNSELPIEPRPKAESGFGYRMPHGGIVDKRYWDEATKGDAISTYGVANDNMRIDFTDGSTAVVVGLRDK